MKTKELQILALCREIAKELSLELVRDALEPAPDVEEPALDGRLPPVLFLYTCAAWSGEPEAREGREWGWFTRAEAARLDMPRMDWALLEGLSG